jgi:hypothetical protein
MTVGRPIAPAAPRTGTAAPGPPGAAARGPAPPTSQSPPGCVGARPADRLDGVLARAILARNGDGAAPAAAKPKKLSPREEMLAKRAAAAALALEMTAPIPVAFQIPNRSPATQRQLAKLAKEAPDRTAAILALAHLPGAPDAPSRAAPALAVAEITALTGCGRPLDELRLLAAGKPTLPRDRTVIELAGLAARGEALTVDETLALARVDWPIADIGALAAAKPGLREGRTVLQLAELAATGTAPPRRTRLTPEMLLEIARLDRPMDDLRRLAAAPLPRARTVAEIAELLALGGSTPTLTTSEAVALAGVDRPMTDLKPMAAGKPTLVAGRTVADIVKLAAHGSSAAPRLTAAEVVALVTTGGVAATMTASELVTLIGHLDGADGTKIKEIATSLHPPLAPGEAIELCETLAGDALSGTDIHAVMQAFHTAGVDGTDIAAHITALRTTYLLDEDEAITAHGGKSILTGPMLKAQLVRSLAAGATAVRGLATNMASYPDGTSPAARTPKQLWADCDLALPARTVGTTTETTAQQKTRQRLALNALMTRPGYLSARVQRLFETEEGREPRKVLGPAGEDALSGGHIVSRHVLDGTGDIKNEDDLAMRVLGHAKAPQHSPAGAFGSAADAKKGMQDVLDAMLKVRTTDWDWMRDRLAQGLDVPQTTRASINAPGVKMTGAPVAQGGLPPYSSPGGSGIRPLHAGQDFTTKAAGHWKREPSPRGPFFLTDDTNTLITPRRAKVGFVPGTPLCTRDLAPASVTIRVLGRDCEGAFAFHSAWPQ